MNFNKALLEDFLVTPAGKKAHAFFVNLPVLIREGDPKNKIFTFIDSLLIQPIAEEFYNSFDDPCPSEWLNSPSASFADFEKSVQNELKEFIKEGDGTLRDWSAGIPNLSLYWFAADITYAFPYLFPVHFFKLREIFDELGIILPTLPGQREYKKKLPYYILLCKVLYEFRMQHNLTPEELCVCIYAFALRFTINSVSEILPEPIQIYISGASKEDSETSLLQPNETTVQWWQGHVDMQPGDLQIIYQAAPYSCFSTVWRAITSGCDDPFSLYAGRVWMSHCVRFPAVSFAELKADPVWSKSELVKVRMYGISGRTVTLEEYAALANILQKKRVRYFAVTATSKSEPPVGYRFTFRARY